MLILNIHYMSLCCIINSIFLNRTKWKRQSSLGIEWLMAAAAEHSTTLQYTNTNTNLKQIGINHHSDYIENKLKTTTTSSLMTNPHNSFGNLFQISNMFQGGPSPLSSSIFKEQTTSPSPSLPVTSVNNWFINALSQYSMANKMPTSTNSNSSSAEPFCYWLIRHKNVL